MRPLDPLGLLDLLLAHVRGTDASPDQDGDQHEDALELGERIGPASEPPASDPEALVELYDLAATATYKRGPLAGKRKRTAYPLVDLRRRRVVIVVHQMGVTVGPRWPSWHKVTGHAVVGPDGCGRLLHRPNVRLMAANRVDRAPWHAISLEIAGNFEGVDGSGRWQWGDRNGRGRATDLQLATARRIVARWCREVDELGGVVEGILPHCTTGRDEYGKPNRQICPGSRAWIEVGERSALELGLAIPGDEWRQGGSAIPREWYGPNHRNLRRLAA